MSIATVGSTSCNASDLAPRARSKLHMRGIDIDTETGRLLVDKLPGKSRLKYLCVESA